MHKLCDAPVEHGLPTADYGSTPIETFAIALKQWSLGVKYINIKQAERRLNPTAFYWKTIATL